jgi:lipoyl(octanoyl) transferase
MSRREQRTLRICRLGRVEYEATAALQRGLRAAREAGAIDDVLLVLEHDPVITCGTRTQESEVAFARTRDIPLVAVERGGKATYHGPGQVVAYPIFGIDIVDGDVPVLVQQLEGAIIATLAAHGVDTDRRAGLPGVWVDAHEARPRKIASLGLRLTRGVTFHGIAVNAACDLAPFVSFAPCGIDDVEMTNLARELGMAEITAGSEDGELLTRSVAESLERRIAEAFAYDAVQAISADDLRLIAMRHEYEQPRVRLPWEPRTTTAIDVSGKESVHA